MALNDFLNEGAAIPEGSALKATTSQTILPAWYTNYAMDVLAGQQALSAQPYSTYQGPRVAGFNPTQQQGFDLTGAAAGAYQPGLTAATQATQNLTGVNSLGVAQPYLTQAGGLNSVGAAQPHFTGALNSINNATQVSGLNAAQPYLNASFGSAANPSSYMNPYIDQVVNRVGELGARNLREQLLPEIEGRYIGAGQWGGSGQMTDTARALRDVNESVLAQQGQLLNTGYSQAQQTMQSDLGRYGQLGQTAGSLAATQQGNLLRAGEMQGQIGTTLGNLTQQQQQALTNLGQTAGNLAGNDAQAQLAAANQLGNLSGLAQQYGLTGAGALTGVGTAQQANVQQNYDVAYADYLRQKGYPQEQITAMLSTLNGVAAAVPKATQETGIVPKGYQENYEPSTASQVIGGLSGIAGIAKDLGWL